MDAGFLLPRDEAMSTDFLKARGGVGTPVEETQIAMPSVRTSRHRWAVMLAGGDGIRLQSLMLKIAGDARPKQFCSITGGESLLAQTRARISGPEQVTKTRRLPNWVPMAPSQF